MSAVIGICNKPTTVDDVSWTPLVAPIDCDTVSIVNPGSVVLKLRTDNTDSLTEVPLNPGQQFTVTGHVRLPVSVNPRPRFAKGATVMYAQCASGSYAVRQSYT